jgi:hypothetical protein
MLGYDAGVEVLMRPYKMEKENELVKIKLFTLEVEAGGSRVRG